MIIAIDGHSSCGKSTLAKQIAKHYDYTYVDTGAMYRAVTYYFIEQNLIENQSYSEGDLKNVKIEFRAVSDGEKHLFLNGQDVENEIRSMKVANKVSEVSSLAFVRKELVEMQRKMGQSGNIVLDGRDIGTVVFPNAEVKIFLTASAEVRAQRRFDEMQEKGIKVDYQEVYKNVVERDFQDENRKVSPLKKADDATLIDNSHLTRTEQLEKALQLIDSAK